MPSANRTTMPMLLSITIVVSLPAVSAHRAASARHRHLIAFDRRFHRLARGDRAASLLRCGEHAVVNRKSL